MQKHSRKKGMALANTLILMLIIFVLCTLMMTLMMYNVSQTRLATSQFEYEKLLDDIGTDFCEYKARILTEYLMLDERGMQMTDAEGNLVSEYTYIPNGEGGIEPNSIHSVNRVITVTEHEDGRLQLTVTNRRATPDVLLTIILEEDVVTAWCYGQLPS